MKLYMIIMGGLCLAACSSPAPEQTSEEAPQEVKEWEKTTDILNDYKAFVTSLDPKVRNQRLRRQKNMPNSFPGRTRKYVTAHMLSSTNSTKK